MPSNALEGEIIESSSVPKSPPPRAEMLDEKEESAFSEFLEELHLSKSHIFYGLGCIVLLVGFVWGGMAGWRYYKNLPSQKAPIVEVPAPKSPTQITIQETGVPSTSSVGKVFILPPSQVGETGVLATAQIGEEEAGVTHLSDYIMTFRRLQNAYGVNIEGLLNQATDRRARLHSHVALLKKLLDEGLANQSKMTQEMAALQTEYLQEQTKQQVDDANFFEQLNALNPKTTEDILADFLDVSQKVVNLRGQYKALQKVRQLYVQGLPKLQQRIRDIELNEEPLVAGIKVYDVTGSDLELIVPVNGGVTIPEEERLSNSAFPLLPSQVTTGQDFITQPGGGFADVVQPGSSTQIIPTQPKTGRDFITQPGGGF